MITWRTSTWHSATTPGELLPDIQQLLKGFIECMHLGMEIILRAHTFAGIMYTKILLISSFPQIRGLGICLLRCNNNSTCISTLILTVLVERSLLCFVLSWIRVFGMQLLCSVLEKLIEFMVWCQVGCCLRYISFWVLFCLSHFPIVWQVCKFLEVSRLSFSPEYGPKLKEDYVMVKHLPKIHRDDEHRNCCSCQWFSCCKDNWQKVIIFSAKLSHEFFFFIFFPGEEKTVCWFQNAINFSMSSIAVL